MAAYYRTQGFVLKKSDRGEADQVFTIFTKDFGKIEILGKAIRKTKSKLRPNIDIFSVCEIEFIQGKTYRTLTDVKTIEGFCKIKSNLEKAEMASRISDSLDSSITGQEKDQKIWNLLRETFCELNNCQFKDQDEEKKGLEILYRYFIFNFLSALGYR